VKEHRTRIARMGSVLVPLVVAVFVARPVLAEVPTPLATPTAIGTPTATATPGPGTPTPSPTPATESGPPASADGTEAPTDPDTSVTIGKGPVAFHVDLGAWIGKLLTGLWKALGVNGITGFGDDIAGWLLTNPNLTATDGQMGNVQRMVDALRLASLSLVIVLFLATVYRFWLGGETAPTAALGRLVTVLFALGFYKQLVGLLVAASNAVAQGALHAGTNGAHPDFGAILGAIPGTSPLWALIGRDLPRLPLRPWCGADARLRLPARRLCPRSARPPARSRAGDEWLLRGLGEAHGEAALLVDALGGGVPVV